MRSGVGAVCERPRPRLRDFADVRFFFFAVLNEVELPAEELCAALDRGAVHTKRAALAKSAAPKMNSEARFLIDAVYCSGAGTAPARYTVSNCSPPDRRRTLNKTFWPGFRPVTARR